MRDSSIFPQKSLQGAESGAQVQKKTDRGGLMVFTFKQVLNMSLVSLASLFFATKHAFPTQNRDEHLIVQATMEQLEAELEEAMLRKDPDEVEILCQEMELLLGIIRQSKL